MNAIEPLPADFDIASEFPIVRKWTFLNHAAVAPISASAARAIEQFAREARDDAYLTGQWYRRADAVRQLAAQLINAEPEEIAFVKNTSEGLAFVANGLQWKRGQRIISTAVEYPSNVYPWMDLAQRFGVEHVMLPEQNGRIDTQAVLNAINDSTRMVALSHVEFGSGFRFDLSTIGVECRRRGVLLCVDAIQSCGVMPVDVKAMNIDFLSADGHKWLLGPEGAGIFYCRKDLIAGVRPEVGWMNVINSKNYGDYNFTLRPDAKRFECGSYNIPGILGLGASLEVILKIGIDAISRRVLALTDRLIAGLTQKGYKIVSSRRPGETSGIVSFTAMHQEYSKIVSALDAQKIIIAQRVGRLRVSPHFYNTLEDIDRLLAALPDDRA
ncbi:MAG TPA: aminotransferase class V-fold PLP-dependent enzyme [Phycisphaerae bacterium]|nr:aminotransferase class V-fold PLP-dependent enzyme [Phycisphaerae bacterium]